MGTDTQYRCRHISPANDVSNVGNVEQIFVSVASVDSSGLDDGRHARDKAAE